MADNTISWYLEQRNKNYQSKNCKNHKSDFTVGNIEFRKNTSLLGKISAICLPVICCKKLTKPAKLVRYQKCKTCGRTEEDIIDSSARICGCCGKFFPSISAYDLAMAHGIVLKNKEGG